MRYLSKIIFINSASVQYSEIGLDGNVHFTGTQGVGKSTLLRAILFFYNADKTKLGISREKKPFDEYYLTYDNSYLIYEVKTENITYFIVAFKSQGRTAFRFIDTAYDSTLFIDDYGEARMWNDIGDSIRKRGAFFSSTIRSYAKYRDILYGNNRGLDAMFRKFALIESKQYQNIPRTIQNVFLNSKLDAEFIKQTIIKSLDDDEITIDLTTYSQGHLKDFEMQYSDIKKWTAKNKTGEIKLQLQADKVSTAYQKYLLTGTEKINLALEIGAALQILEKQQPIYERQLVKEQEKQQKVNRESERLSSKFEAEKGSIQTEIGGYKSKLKDATEKQRNYAEKHIESIIERVEKKMELESEKQGLIEQKQILTTQFADIEQRYNAQTNQFKNQLETFTNQKNQKKNEIDKAFVEYKEHLNEQYQQQIETIRKQHDNQLKVIQNTAKELQEKIAKLQENKIEITYKKLYETEISNCKLRIKKTEDSTSTSNTDIKQAEQTQENLRKVWEFEKEKISIGHQSKINEKNKEKDVLQEKITVITRRIDKNEGSLYHWLNDEVPQWEKHIGKVIDEQTVLFSKNLNPQKINPKDHTFYGIQIDLKQIKKSVKTIENYEKECVEYRNSIKNIKSLINEINTEQEEALTKLKKKYQPKINRAKENIDKCKYIIEQNIQSLKSLNLELTALQEKAQSEKTKELDRLKEAIKIAKHEKEKKELEAEKIRENIQQKINAKNDQKRQLISDERQKTQEKIKNIKEEISRKNEDTRQAIKTLKEEQNKELESEGAPVIKIQNIQNKINTIGTELEFIENNTRIVNEYQKDKRELFDKIGIFEQEINQLEEQLKNKNDEYESEKQKLKDAIDLYGKTIKEITKKLEQYKEDKDAYKDLQNKDWYHTIQSYIDESKDKQASGRSCTSLIVELTETHYQSRERMDDLKNTVNKFAGNFSDDNLFNFNTRFAEYQDYIAFSKALKEFIEEDKIAEFKKRVSERFAYIIRQIGKEIGDMMAKEGEIQKIITKINNDFTARNFVGAVKELKMRITESPNRIVKLLTKIQKFNQEETLNIGSNNLFTTADNTQKNNQAVELLKKLTTEINNYKPDKVTLSDSFGLEFRIKENDNDTGWVEKLANVGSEGTDVLVKAMINIMLLNVFKDMASIKHKEFKLHCVMDEIGKLHPNNERGILKFANDRNILLVNGSPTSHIPMDYKYTFHLEKNSKNITEVKRIITKVSTT